MSPQAVQSTLTGASRTAETIEDCADRAAAFARIAELLHRAGERAVHGPRRRREDRDGSTRASALAGIARAQGSVGDLPDAVTSVAEAVEVAREIEDETDRVLMLVDLCGADVTIEDFAAAERTMAEALRVDEALKEIAATNVPKDLEAEDLTICLTGYKNCVFMPPLSARYIRRE